MLSRKRQQVVILLTAVVLAGVFVLLRYLPLKKRIKAVESRLAETQFAVDKAQAQSQRLAAIKETLLTLQRTAGNYDRQVPDHRELGEFLHRITDLMNENKLTGQMIQPGKEVSTEQLNCIPVSIKCKGRLTQIFGFFKSLQDMDRLIRIEQVKLVNASDFNGQVNMQTEAVIYYKAEAGRG